MPANPFAYSGAAGATPSERLLPPRNKRVLVGIVMSRVLDLKLEVLAILEDVPKNELVLRALSKFLAQAKSCDAGHAFRLGARQKRRITLTLSEEIDQKLEHFARKQKCQKTCVITAAMVAYLQSQKIDPYCDPSKELRSALQVVPLEDSGSW